MIPAPATVPVWLFWLSLGNFIISTIVGVYSWWNSREKVTNARFKKLEDRMMKMESKVERMPVCDNHQRMETNDTRLFERLDTLHGDIRELAGGMKKLDHSLNLINEHLLRRGNR